MTNQPPSFNESVEDQSITTPTRVTEPSAVFPPPPAAYPPTTIDPENPPWAHTRWLGALIALLVWFASVLCLVFVPLILVLPYVVYQMMNKSQAVITQLENDKTVLFLSVLGVIPAHVVTFLLCYLIVTRWRSYPLGKTLGLSWPPTWGPVKGFIICVLIAGALFGGGALITWYLPGQKTQIDLLIESSYGARLVTAFLAVVTAPLVEEIVYRGILYPATARLLGSLISPVFGVVAGIIVVSSLFAAVHVVQYWNNLAVIGVITLVSITLTTVRAYTRRLLPCLVIHLVFNGIQAVIILLSPFLPKPEQPAPPPAPAELLAFVGRLLS